jgi:hypothetical protein
LFEEGPEGYTAGDWSCNGGTLSVNKITLVEGETEVTCTINNDDVPPTLKLVKTVTTDNGGDAVPNDWTLRARKLCVAGDPDPNCGFENLGGSGTFQAVLANTAYTLFEEGPDGYTAGDWSCDGGTLNVNKITLAEGETEVTCTINNDDIPPTLRLVKTVTNDNGGEAEPDDWTLRARKLCAAGDPDPNCGFENLGGSGTFQAVLANTAYTLFEEGPEGYTAGDWSCDGGTLSVNKITLVEGETEVTCTINNDDTPPTLKLVKTVTNDNGGDAEPDDWTLRARKLCAAGDPDPNCGFENLGGSGTFQAVLANTAYTLFEDGPDGYTAGDWSCDGGTLNVNKITLVEGETEVTCTINNDDIAPTLKLVKTVTNDAGGTAVPNDWILRARKLCAAGDPDPNCGFENLGGSGTFQALLANTPYTLFEEGPGGYTAGGWSCDGGTLSVNKITLVEGETEVTCTINNDDIAPTLTVNKIVIGDYPGDEGLFNLTIDTTAYATNVGDGGTTGPVLVSAGTRYAGETAGTGTSLENYVIEIGGDCAEDGSVTLGLAENKICTITNTAKSLVNVLKLTGGVVDDTRDWTFGIYEGPNEECGDVSGPDGCSDFLNNPLATDNTLGDADGVLDFDGLNLDSELTYTVCELGVNATWTTVWMVDTTGDGVADTELTPYNPNASDDPDPGEDLGNRCADFGFDTDWTLDPGETLVFQVDNQPPPGGDARTPGYWKNWSTCSNGNQAATADKNSEDLDSSGTIEPNERIAAGFALIDDVLPIDLGEYLTIDNCQDAVDILDHRDLLGKKRASDAAYKLARSLLAYEANTSAGAGTCQEAVEAAIAGDALLSSIGFDGIGKYLRPKDSEYQLAVELAGTLDEYNNNLLCP